jgi:hypothetical protein
MLHGAVAFGLFQSTEVDIQPTTTSDVYCCGGREKAAAQSKGLQQYIPLSVQTEPYKWTRSASTQVESSHSFH